MTGKREAYYSDHRGTPQELISAARHGYLFQGQRYAWQMQPRGTRSDGIPARAFVTYLENHDQVANSRDGRRLHQLTSPGRYRALTALLLLGPQTPLLFQGEEFGSSAPFLYFADHGPELAALVKQGRAKFLAQFASTADYNDPDALPDPADPDIFRYSQLDWSERERNTAHLALHKDLIALARRDPVLSSENRRIDGAVLGPAAFVLRFFADDGNDRLLLVNLGVDLPLPIVPEPLLAPADAEKGWTRIWHSDEPRYGGRGAPPLEAVDEPIGKDKEGDGGGPWAPWRIPAESAQLLVAFGA